MQYFIKSTFHKIIARDKSFSDMIAQVGIRKCNSCITDNEPHTAAACDLLGSFLTNFFFRTPFSDDKHDLLSLDFFLKEACMPDPSSTPSICAIVCVRNESRYLPALIKHLREQGVDIAFIDNESTDGSRDIIEGHIGGDVLNMKTLAFNGVFSLSDQLQAKAEVESELHHDWVMHVDADEIHHASNNGVRLVDLAKRAEAANCNAINFEEFVFVPEKNHDGTKDNSHLDILRYYYFAPTFNRLLRLYRRGEGLDNRAGAGHRLQGNPRIYPQTQVLRHYITLDQKHLLEKYIGRAFDPSELAKRWHGNRIGLTEEMLDLGRFARRKFDYLPSRDSRAFLRNRLRSRHFWSW